MPSYQQAVNLFHHPGMFLIAGGAIAVLLLWRYIRTVKDLFKFALIAAVIAAGIVGLSRFSKAITAWQKASLKPHIVQKQGNGVLPTLDFSNSVNSMNPVTHMNPLLLAIALSIAGVWGLGYLFYRGMSPTSRARWRKRIAGFFTFSASTERNKDNCSEFEYPAIEVGVDKQTGKPITIAGADRFIGTQVVGSTGTGKTSRVLAKGAYQDLAHIAQGIPMDLFVMDPDGGLIDSVLTMADRLNIKDQLVIDLRGSKGRDNTVSFNPFQGGDIPDIIDNVRAVLKEQMGNQDAFFQNAQDDLVRTVIQVQLPLWPDTDFIKFSELITDPLHFRSVCQMVFNHVNRELLSRNKKGKKDDDDLNDIDPAYAHEIAYVQARYDELDPNIQSMVLSASRSFLQDTRTEQKLEHLEKITKGLKIVVNELSSNPKMREVLGTGDLPVLNFGEFFAAGKETPGRVLAIVTGNRPMGNLFGKLVLVSYKMYLLNRAGNENTRRPVYKFVDEFHRYATDSLSEEFVQGRKYRGATMFAIQERSQLKLRSNPNFLNAVEGSSRNKIYFPSLAPEDARFLEASLGSVVNLQESQSENKLSLFLVDGRRPDRKVTTRESVDPRFRVEDLQFGLTKDEAIFAMTVDNQAQVPAIGVTSYADVWVNENKKMFKVKREAEVSSESRSKSGSNSKFSSAIRSKIRSKVSSTHNVVSEETAMESKSREESAKQSADMVKQTSYLRANANLDEVISLGNPVTLHPNRDTEMAPQEAIVEPQTAVTESPAVISLQREPEPPISAARSSLRRKQVETETESDEKQCPNCRVGVLQLTEDLKKWRCSAPSCGFERKNRSANSLENVT